MRGPDIHSMEDGIERKYADIVSICISFLRLKTTLEKEVVRLWWDFSGPRSDEARRAYKGFHPLVFVNSGETRRVLGRLASRAERENPVFDLVLSDYPLEALALEVIHRMQLDRQAVETLQSHHSSRRWLVEELEKNLIKTWSVPAAAVGFVLGTIPKEFWVARGLAYSDVVNFTVSALVLAVMVVAVPLIPGVIAVRRARREWEFINMILAHAALLSMEISRRPNSGMQLPPLSRRS